METPSIPDKVGGFCWELDVELQFRLEECHVFIVVWKVQQVLDESYYAFHFPSIIELSRLTSVDFNCS